MSAPSSGSGDAAVGPPTARALILLIAATLAARLLVSALMPLTEDEAYYRLWSMRPAFGYFDHPPMIAWWIWLGRQVAGDTPLGVRLLPSLAAAATTWLTFDLARLAALGPQVALRAAIWLNATLLVAMGAMLAGPDAPATLFWVLSLWCAFRATRGAAAWWLAAGLAAGLACLSKYSALFLAPGLLLWLVTTAEGRRQLRTPWPWLAAIVAAAVFAPNVIWNADHGWMTFVRQFGRVRAAGFAPGYLVKFAVDQFALLNPLIAAFVVLAIARRSAAPMLLICVPFVAYLLVHSLHDEVQGQWPAPLYPALAIAAAAAADSARGWLVWLRTAAPWLGFTAAALALVFIIAPSDGQLPFRDPARDFRGWPAFRQAVEAQRVATGAAWVSGTDYGLAAELAAPAELHAPATEIFERQRFTFETPAERADFTRPGLVLIPPTRDPSLAALTACFVRVTPLAPIDRGAGRGRVTYQAYLVAQPRRDVESQGCSPAT